MSFILPKRIITTSRKDQISKYQSDEKDISTSLNMISIDSELMKRDDYEFVDDYTCFDSKETNPACMKTNTEVSAETEKRFHEIMTNNKESFAAKPDQLGCCKGATFEIETTSEVLVHSVPYRQPPALNKRLEEEVNYLLKANIIRKGSAGTWSSPAFMIKQKGKDRMVINYQKVNQITKIYKHPQPNCDEHLYSFQNTNYFSQIDLRKGFYQLPISEKTKHKSGFVKPFGIYEFNRLPFGLTTKKIENTRVTTHLNYLNPTSEHTASHSSSA